MVVSIDSGHEHFLILACIEREDSVILEKDYALTRRLEGSLTMLRTEAHIHCCRRIGKRLFEESKTELDAENPSYRLVDS